MDNPYEQNKDEYKDLLQTLILSGGTVRLNPRQHGLLLARMQQMIALGLVQRTSDNDPFNFDITDRGRNYLLPGSMAA